MTAASSHRTIMPLLRPSIVASAPPLLPSIPHRSTLPPSSPLSLPFTPFAPLRRCCSFDGDADRLVFFFTQLGSGSIGAEPSSSGESIDLLDGDKIASLAAAFIRDLLDRLPENIALGVKV